MKLINFIAIAYSIMVVIVIGAIVKLLTLQLVSASFAILVILMSIASFTAIVAIREDKARRYSMFRKELSSLSDIDCKDEKRIALKLKQIANAEWLFKHGKQEF